MHRFSHIPRNVRMLTALVRASPHRFEYIFERTFVCDVTHGKIKE